MRAISPARPAWCAVPREHLQPGGRGAAAWPGHGAAARLPDPGARRPGGGPAGPHLTPVATTTCVGADDLEDMIEMRVLVSADMEGIAGVVHGDDIRPGH